MSEKYSNYCNRVFEIFEELSKIPRGSGHMDQIAEYCTQFAERCGLRYVRDKANNVIIYKQGSKGCENAEPVILQGHLDMVWQKTPDCKIDFLTDGIEIFREGDFLRAKGTTLGADNGIAVAMALCVLEGNDFVHPPIEAVFTTDEEIGMLGAIALDTSLLSAHKLINIDSEEDDTVTVSCAGGGDFRAVIPIKRISRRASCLKIDLGGLKGGHSGVEINSHRVNAAMLSGRILNYLQSVGDFDIVSVNSGDKANAIPNASIIEIVSDNCEALAHAAEEYIGLIKAEIAHNEPCFYAKVSVLEEKDYAVLDSASREDVIYSLTCVPNGIMEMSAEIEGLVETSLNLGILSTVDDEVSLHFALRGNKGSALKFLEDKMIRFFSKTSAKIEVFGHYPPWEYKDNSDLKVIYCDTYKEMFGTAPKVEAIHAGLECAIFSSAIKNADCIAIGPTIYDAHTTNERLGISSTEKIFKALVGMLAKLSEK